MLTKLFYVILDTGISPEQWSLAIIKPLYKNVGEREDPSNYRGISLLSCLGKVFSNLINDRLTRFVNGNNIRTRASRIQIWLLNIRSYFINKDFNRHLP